MFLILSLLYLNQKKRRNYVRRWFYFFSTLLCGRGQRQRTINVVMTCPRYFGFKMLRDIIFFLSVSLSLILCFYLDLSNNVVNLKKKKKNSERSVCFLFHCLSQLVALFNKNLSRKIFSKLSLRLVC